MSNTKLLFVLGVGRSGTSLLQSMLAVNPEVSYMPETSFLRRYVATGKLASIYASGGEAAVVQQLSNDKNFARSGLDVEEIIRSALKSDRGLDAAVYSMMVEVWASENVSYVGDKDPRLVEFLPVLASLFLGSSIIHMIRDPRDVLLSKKKAAWSSKGHVWKHIFANRVQLRLGRFWGPRLFGDNYHEIIYEDLIAFPDAVLTDLCQKLELSFDHDMLNFGEAAQKLVSNEELSWKKETLGPLLTKNKEKWKEGLSEKEIALTEICCGQAFEIGRYRYRNPARGLSLPDRVWVWTGAVAIFLMDWPYRMYRKYKVTRACKQMG